jgi:ribosome biogenesis GTPase A
LNKKCIGCGLELNNQKDQPGYTPKPIEQSEYCMRCFKLKNYGQISEKKLASLSPEMIQQINQEADEIILISDILNLDFTLNENVLKQFTKPINIVVNKLDLLPKSHNYERIAENIVELLKKRNIKFSSLIVVSLSKNTYFDLIEEFISQIEGPNIYLLGTSNVGKSSFLSRLLKNKNILVSQKSGSTKELMEYSYNNKVIFDTPGIIDPTNYQTYLNLTISKRLLQQKEIKVRTFQYYEDQSYYIEDFAAIKTINNQNENKSISFYIPNQINIHRRKAGDEIEHLTDMIQRIYTKNIDEDVEYITHKISLSKNEELIINGLGYIQANDDIQFDLTIFKKISFKKRKKIFRGEGNARNY